MDRRKTIISLLKLFVAALSMFFIWHKVSGRSSMGLDWETLWAQPDAGSMLSLLCLLMLVNWGLESLKWRYLVSPYITISPITAFRAVMSGTTIGLFTPNRVGEFAGRILHLPSGYRVNGTLATITGNLSQLVVTLVAGSVSLFLVTDTGFGPDWMHHMLVRFVAGGILLVSLIFYFLIPRLSGFHIPWLQTVLVPLNAYGRHQLLIALLISALRYAVFSIQYIIALRWFGVAVPVPEGFEYIAIIFLFMTLVPTFSISEIAVRGSVALLFLAPVYGDSYPILAASTLIWMINLALPAVMGAVSSWWIRLNS